MVYAVGRGSGIERLLCALETQLDVRAAKMLVYVSVAAGDSRFSGHGINPMITAVSEGFSTTQNWRPLTKEGSTEDINILLCLLLSSNNSGDSWRGTQHLVYFSK